MKFIFTCTTITLQYFNVFFYCGVIAVHYENVKIFLIKLLFFTCNNLKPVEFYNSSFKIGYIQIYIFEKYGKKGVKFAVFSVS